MEVSARNQTDRPSEDVEKCMECDPCLCDSKIVTAEWFCTDCDEYMCDNCARAHRNSKVSRNHKLLGRDEMPKIKLTTLQEKFCANHANKQMEYFCKKDDQLCCSVCVTLEHSQCGVLFINEIAGGFNTSQEYQDLLTQIKLLETKLTETKEELEKNCEDVKQCFTTLISDIHQFRSQINAKLDELERKVREEAQEIKADDLKSIESISAQSEAIQTHLKEMSSTLESLEKCKQNQQLFISSKHYLAEVMELKHKMEKFSFVRHIKKYSFECSKDILNSLDTCCKLIMFDSHNTMYEDPKHIKAKFMKSINIEHKQDSSSYCGITGSDLLTCESLALTDWRNYSVKLIDLHRDTVISCLQLADQPRDLTCMDSNTMAVTCKTNLTFLKFDRKLSIMKQIPLEDDCHGITSHQNKLFVTFIGKPCVKILNSGGAVLQTIQTDSQGQDLFVRPGNITLSTDGQIIYVSDWVKHTVTSYSENGKQLNVYKHEDLRKPSGLTTIENKFIFVCGLESANIHNISYLGEHIQIILETKDMGKQPLTVLYNRKNLIYITYDENNSVYVFKLE